MCRDEILSARDSLCQRRQAMGVRQLRRVACDRDTVNARADLAVMQGVQKFFRCVDVL